MEWALWLLIPVAVTVLAALGSWLRARPRRRPTTDEAMRAHGDFLDALGSHRADTLPECASPSRRSTDSRADEASHP
jgi:hypothetical protein